MAVGGDFLQQLNMLSLGGPRKHVVIFSRECLFVNNQQQLNAELGVLALKSNLFELYFTTYGDPSKEELLACFAGIPVGSCIHRKHGLREFISNCWTAGKVVIICGTVNEDMYIAAHTKSFLIAALWATPEVTLQKYGIPALTPSKMRALIEIVANQTAWYYSCTFNSFPVPNPGPVPVPTKVVSLCLVNTKTAGVSVDEQVMAEAFQKILKDGDNNPVIKEALFCHLMAAIAHDDDFREVQDWAVAPSSSGSLNPVMDELKERVRCMMYGRKPEPIFIRHTPTGKSRHDPSAWRYRDDYGQKHFKSIRVNDHYRGKLKGRVVCVLDDYLRHGNTFEALRNLLVACEVKKIIFVSIGKFKPIAERSYVQKDFCIDGDVHTANYAATFSRKFKHKFQCEDNARRSLEDLKILASNLQ